MDKSIVVQMMMDKIYRGEIQSFQYALHSTSQPELAVLASLYALGFDEVHMQQSADMFTFNAKILANESESLVTFDRGSGKISGLDVDDIEKAFDLAVAIEGRLTKAMNYPPDMRGKVINEVCSELSIDSKFYSRVLKNWKSS